MGLYDEEMKLLENKSTETTNFYQTSPTGGLYDEEMQMLKQLEKNNEEKSRQNIDFSNIGNNLNNFVNSSKNTLTGGIQKFSDTLLPTIENKVNELPQQID